MVRCDECQQVADLLSVSGASAEWGGRPVRAMGGMRARGWGGVSSKGDRLLKDPRWQRVKRQAWDRDRRAGAPCWVCGGRIDYSVRPSSTDDAWEPDHEKPRELFPQLAYDLANIKPSHRHCNRSRKAGARADKLGKPSREWRRRNAQP